MENVTGPDEKGGTSRRTLLAALGGIVGGLLAGCGLSPSIAADGKNGGKSDGKGDKGRAAKGKTKMSSVGPLGAAKITDGTPAKADAPAGKELATLGAGCFWCVEAVFTELRGVDTSVSGYSGGGVANPSYEAVCTGTTGHAEVIQVTYDPKVIAFADLLRVFFTTHDPTTLNRQGGDVGTQYRSAIFYHSPAQKAAAEKVIKEITAEGIWPDPIVTEVTPFKNFYAAESYHQNYYALNANQGYCRVVIEPKVRKFREKYRALLKK